VSEKTDSDWARRLGIVCKYPDGADRCTGCPHYQHPDRYSKCDYDERTFEHVGCPKQREGS